LRFRWLTSEANRDALLLHTRAKEGMLYAAASLLWSSGGGTKEPGEQNQNRTLADKLSNTYRARWPWTETKEQKANCRPISGKHMHGTKKLARVKAAGSQARIGMEHGRASVVDSVGGWCGRPAWRARAGK
jgi:hypothetical protein